MKTTPGASRAASPVSDLARGTQRKKYLTRPRTADTARSGPLASIIIENDRTAVEVWFFDPLPPGAFEQFVIDVTTASNRALFGTPDDPGAST